MSGAPLASGPLVEHLIHQLSLGRRALVVIDRNDAGLAWREAFEEQVLHRFPWTGRVIRTSSGFHTVELLGGSGRVDVVTTRSIEGGAARGRTCDQVILPADASEELCAATGPSAAHSVHGRLLHHLVGAP